MTNHTPGPWFVDQQGAPTIRRADGAVISGVPSNYADACLIAAAPDLLEALKAAAKHIHDEIWQFGARADSADTNTLKAINAAIAKAEGS